MQQQLTESTANAEGTPIVRCEQRARRAGSYAKRTFDLILGLFLLPMLSVPMAAIAVAVKLTSKGSILYWSDRVGRNNRIFRMPKFRTMNLGTPEVATHLLRDPEAHLTIIGSFLRKTSFDELPQIYSVLKGDLSFVGPRPALHNQNDLVALRTERGVHALIPGLTGWAQVKYPYGSTVEEAREKLKYDLYYIKNVSMLLDLWIIFQTVKTVLLGRGAR